MKTDRTIDIFVFQAKESGRFACTSLFKLVKLEKDVDYVLTGDYRDISDFVKKGTPQMVIMGTFAGSFGDLVDIVKAARAVNPELVVVMYSSYKVQPGPFDLIIDKASKEDHWTKLSEALEQFRAGTFRTKGLVA